MCCIVWHNRGRKNIIGQYVSWQFTYCCVWNSFDVAHTLLVCVAIKGLFIVFAWGKSAVITIRGMSTYINWRSADCKKKPFVCYIWLNNMKKPKEENSVWKFNRNRTKDGKWTVHEQASTSFISVDSLCRLKCWAAWTFAGIRTNIVWIGLIIKHSLPWILRYSHEDPVQFLAWTVSLRESQPSVCLAYIECPGGNCYLIPKLL